MPCDRLTAQLLHALSNAVLSPPLPRIRAQKERKYVTLCTGTERLEDKSAHSTGRKNSGRTQGRGGAGKVGGADSCKYVDSTYVCTVSCASRERVIDTCCKCHTAVLQGREEHCQAAAADAEKRETGGTIHYNSSTILCTNLTICLRHNTHQLWRGNSDL